MPGGVFVLGVTQGVGVSMGFLWGSCDTKNVLNGTQSLIR